MRLTITFLLLLLATSHAFATTIPVRQGGTSIRQAIELAQPGDTLFIHAGTYKEGNIIIEKSLTIMGENFPVLDGDNKVEIFTVHAQHVTITGLKFINTGVASINDLAAIKVLDSKWLRIINNRFENTFFGIH